MVVEEHLASFAQVMLLHSGIIYAKHTRPHNILTPNMKMISTNERNNVRNCKIRVLMAPRATERMEPKVRVTPKSQSDIGKPLRA